MPEPDATAMGQYVQRLTEAQSVLYGAIQAMLGGSADAPDVLQETNRVLWRKAAEYDATRPFLPWALAVARFEVLAHRKRRSRDRLVFDDLLLEQIADDYERLPAGGAMMQALESCLQKLPRIQRAVVERRYTEGVSVNEIAFQEGKAAAAISTLLYRIRGALAECIERTLAKEGSS